MPYANSLVYSGTPPWCCRNAVVETKLASTPQARARQCSWQTKSSALKQRKCSVLDQGKCSALDKEKSVLLTKRSQCSWQRDISVLDIHHLYSGNRWKKYGRWLWNTTTFSQSCASPAHTFWKRTWMWLVSKLTISSTGRAQDGDRTQ